MIILSPIFAEPIFAADPYAEATKEVAEKIVKCIGRLENVEFTFQARTSLGAKEVSAARQSLESELHARGMRLANTSQPDISINVTLSENINQLIWIAQIRQPQNSSLLMTTQPRPQPPPLQEAALRMAIQVKLLYEQKDPVLDVKWQEDELLILDPQRLALYHRKNDSWELESSTPLKPPYPFPRDIRGRLFTEGETLQVHVPFLSCKGATKPSLTLVCSQDETPWPIGLGVRTPKYQNNYFVLENLPPFYSVANVVDDETELLALAGIDGQTYLFGKAANQVGIFDSWGDDFGAIDAGCGARRPILVALAQDPPEREAIQAFEIVHRKPVAVSSAVEFPGPVTALWSVPGQNSAIAIAYNLKTGNYAAYHLSISCSR